MRRRLLMAKVSGFAAAAACLPAIGQIFKCPDGEGFAFQQAPCAGLDKSGGRLLVYPNGRPVAAAAASASDMPRNARVLGRTALPVQMVVARTK